MGTLSVEASGLRALLDRLVTYKVLVWGPTSNNPDLTTDRVVTDINDADVVSSLLNEGADFSNSPPKGRHMVVLDIDHPTYLVKSSTPGHFHLYIDVPGGIEHSEYMILLRALAACGIIEPGYAGASQARGHSDVRLPWIKKDSDTGGDSR